MDWEKFAWTWGPAWPLIAFLLRMVYDAVYKQIPAGFASIRNLAVTHESAAKDRHEEHMRIMKKVRKQLKRNKEVCQTKPPADRLTKSRRRQPSTKK